jgi:ribosomal RNA-processing protein 1
MGTFEAAEKAAKSKKGEKVVVSTKPTIVATTSKAIIKKTKRQRRKDEQKGEKNKWLIQHPKIQSMEHRQLIYVKDAGLNETKAEKKQLPIDPKLDLMSPEVKFGRMLAGTDQRKRHAAVKKLKAYLKARCDIAEVGAVSGGISELDLLKLWKSLWYTLYMADKKAVQDELSKHVCKLLWCVVGTEEEDECAGRAYLEMIEAEAAEDDDGEDDDVTMTEIENTLEEEKDSESDDDDDVKEDSEESGHGMEDNDDEEDQEMEMDNVNIPHCRGAHLVSLFVRTFFRTIRRDWHTMDKYRVDKFYTLIRTMMHEIYEYMAVRGWNYGIVLLLNDAIFDEILKQPPNGLRYHLIDLCLEELAKVNAKAAIPLTEATFLDVLEPFFGLCQTGTSTHDDTVQSRVMDGVLGNFLENYSVVSEKALPQEDKDDDDDDDGDDNKKNESCTANIFDQVHVKTVAEFIFALGSDPATSDKYRKSLYDMHKKFMRRVKEVGIDVEIGDDDMEGEYNQFLDEEMRDDSEGGYREHNCGYDHGHDHHDHVGGDDTEDEQPDETPIEVEKETKSSKKKKKKKKRKSDEMEADPVATPKKDDNAKVDEKKSKKKKKTKVVVSPSKSTSTDEKSENQKRSKTGNNGDDDEEVVITLTEQQDAKKKDKKAKKAKLQKEQHEDIDDEELNNNCKDGSRRVSFGKKNRAKSHKASVKATRLKLETPHSMRELTPVKGILPKEFKYSSNSKTKKTSTKAGRNKATSYF